MIQQNVISLIDKPSIIILPILTFVQCSKNINNNIVCFCKDISIQNNMQEK